MAPVAGCTLAELLPGQERASAAGTHYEVCRPLAELWSLTDSWSRRIEQARTDLASRAVPPRPEVAAFLESFPAGGVLLDLETCGFAGSPIFLVGLIHALPVRGLVLEQLLARTYAEEASLLVALGQRLEGRQVLVTFNGKSFDWPLVVERSIRHRLEGAGADRAPLAHHWDLLHHARRRWRTQLPNCRLQTLERFVCRRLRRGDIPGSQIPQEYHHFVRTGDARQICTIVQHNALDLVTLAEIAGRIAAE